MKIKLLCKAIKTIENLFSLNIVYPFEFYCPNKQIFSQNSIDLLKMDGIYRQQQILKFLSILFDNWGE